MSGLIVSQRRLIAVVLGLLLFVPFFTLYASQDPPAEFIEVVMVDNRTYTLDSQRYSSVTINMLNNTEYNYTVTIGTVDYFLSADSQVYHVFDRGFRFGISFRLNHFDPDFVPSEGTLFQIEHDLSQNRYSARYVSQRFFVILLLVIYILAMHKDFLLIFRAIRDRRILGIGREVSEEKQKDKIGYLFGDDTEK